MRVIIIWRLSNQDGKGKSNDAKVSFFFLSHLQGNHILDVLLIAILTLLPFTLFSLFSRNVFSNVFMT